MRRVHGFTLLELLVVASIIAIIAAIAIPQLLNARRSAWENRCKLTIRALGSSQLAYADQNLEKDYGTFDALLTTDYIQDGYTRSNMIDNYSISVFHTQLASQSGAHDGGFTLVAVPRSNKNRLRTFAICDDQTVRVATDYDLTIPAQAGNGALPGPDNPCTWEPLR